MSAAECNVSSGDVTIADGALKCNNDDKGSVKHVTIRGASSSSIISVSDSNVVIELSWVTTTSTSYFSVSRSNATIILDGANWIQPTKGQGPVECSGSSSLTFWSWSSDGSLTARSHTSFAAIGSGPSQICDSLIFVNGSYVAEALGSDCPGIGSPMASGSIVNTISIYDGNVSAAGCEHAAGIGSGRTGNGMDGVGCICIHNGNITATGGYSDGPGIGSGSAVEGNSSRVDSIFIYNGNITATGGSGYGSGIGSGYGGPGRTSRVDNIFICNGNITATGTRGAGIGSGHGNASVGTISIENGNITAASTKAGAGIGGGSDGARVGVLSISGGSITAVSASGAGIGAGNGSSAGVTEMNILGGSFLIRNGSIGIGAIDDSVPILRIGSPHIDCGKLPKCLGASSVVFDGSLTVVTAASPFVTSGNVSFSGSSSMYTIYTAESQREQVVGLPVIHVESVDFPSQLYYGLKVFGAHKGNAGFARSVLFNSGSARGFGISVPSPGDYRISYKSLHSAPRGLLIYNESTTFAVPDANDTLFTNVSYQLLPTYYFTAALPPSQYRRNSARIVRVLVFTELLTEFDTFPAV
jgi:hypothetical protein